MLDLWKDPWPLDVRQCPCDVHFTEWAQKSGIRDATVFHFGTGDHHHVGKTLSLNANRVLGVTATRPEYDSYIDLIVANPEIGKRYKVLFTDIYQIEPQLLPEFDVITLFHLCEFWSETNAPFATHDDAAVLEAMCEKLKPGGALLFYTGSFAHAAAARLFEKRMAQGDFSGPQTHESLLVYRKRTAR